MKSGIYFLRFSKNRIYVGSSKNVIKRVSGHLKDLFNGTHHNSAVLNCYWKYGEPTFKYFFCEDYREAEQSWIDSFYGKLLNISKSAGGGDLISGHPNLDEIKSKHRVNAKVNVMLGLCALSKSEFGEDNPNWRGGVSYPRCPWPRPHPTWPRGRDNKGSKNPFWRKTHTAKSIDLMKEGQAARPQEDVDTQAYICKQRSGKKIIHDSICFYSINDAAEHYSDLYGYHVDVIERKLGRGEKIISKEATKFRTKVKGRSRQKRYILHNNVCYYNFPDCAAALNMGESSVKKYCYKGLHGFILVNA